MLHKSAQRQRIFCLRMYQFHADVMYICNMDNTNKNRSVLLCKLDSAKKEEEGFKVSFYQTYHR